LIEYQSFFLSISDDILRARVRTVGVQEHIFQVTKVPGSGIRKGLILLDIYLLLIQNPSPPFFFLIDSDTWETRLDYL
jgi:hypothetical protein